MEVSIEAPGGLLREMRVTIPADKLSAAVSQRLKTMSQRAKFPGFRPGKAPRKVVEQQYGASARMDAVSELVQSSYPEALDKAGVRPAGQPQIDVVAEKPGEALEYVAKFEVFPEIQIQGIDSLEVEQPVFEVTEADVDSLIEKLRKGKRELNVVERAAAEGDVVKVDFAGSIDGEPVPGGKGDDTDIEIGSGQMIADLETGLVGHSVGESFNVPVNFPDDYHSENLRGKLADFAVTIKEIKEPVLPAVEDADFLKAHGVESVDALREKSREALDRECAKAVQRNQKSQLMEQIYQNNQIEVPKALIDAELPGMRQQAAARMNMQNVPAEKLAEMMPAELFADGAKRKVTLGLILGEVIKLREIKLDPAKVDEALAKLAGDYEQPEQVMNYYRSNPQMLEGLHSMVLEDQVVDSLLEGAKKLEKNMTLEELLNPQPKPKPAS